MPHTPSIEFCTSPGCNHKVSVIPCRGTKDPQDAGFFYERCNAPGPFSHWLKWRKDIPRLPQDELRYFPFGPAPATMLEALQIPSTPSTMPPFSSPMKPSSPAKGTDPTSSPLKPAPTTPLMPHTPIPPIVFSNAQPPPPPLLPPTAPAFPGTGHVLGDQTVVVNAPVSVASANPVDVPPVATSASTVPAPLDDRSHTRITIVNGKAKVSCNGPVCRENGKPPVRNAQFCVNQFCQKCCLRFQALGGPQCMGTHDPASAKQSKATSNLLLSQLVSTPLQVPQAAPVPTVPSVQVLQAPIQPTPASLSQSVSAPVPHVPTLPNAVSNASGVLLLPSQALAPTATLYNAKRPMDDAHYQAREAKHKAWEQRATQLTESRAKTELLKTTIDIVYWRNATDIPDFLTIPCPSFPTFSLSECSSTTRSMLGIEDDFNKFIPTFDPNRERWVNHTAMTPRDISLHRMLLYRAPTIRCDSAPDMQTAIDEVMALHTKSTSSRKRPAPTTVSTQPLKRMKVDGSPSTVVSEGGIATTPPVAVVKKESVETGTLHRVQQLPKKVKVKPSAVEVLVIDDEELAGTSSSAHGRWPLKYYKAMASGFERIDTMTGPVHARFTAVFGEIDNIKFPSPRTYYKSYAAWDSASPALKEQYLKAGYTDEGLWKHFVRDVRKCFPDGNIPNLLARYGKGKGKGKNSTSEPMDWDGVGEIVVKAEPGVDVLPQVKQEPTEAVFKSDAREIIEISDDE